MRCPCCDQPLAADTKLTLFDELRAVVKNEHYVVLSPNEYKIISAVRRRALSLEALVEAVYGDRADGGPYHASNSVAVTMVKLNRRLAPLGIRVGAERKGAWAPPYKIENVD